MCVGATAVNQSQHAFLFCLQVTTQESSSEGHCCVSWLANVPQWSVLLIMWPFFFQWLKYGLIFFFFLFVALRFFHSVIHSLSNNNTQTCSIFPETLWDSEVVALFIVAWKLQIAWGLQIPLPRTSSFQQWWKYYGLVFMYCVKVEYKRIFFPLICLANGIHYWIHYWSFQIQGN